MGDVRNNSLLNHLMTFYPIKAVVHFAGKSNVEQSAHFPHLYYEENVKGMIALLSAMYQHRIQTIIFSSTAAIYGNAYVHPFEEIDAVNPMTAYGQSKYFMEKMAANYSKSYGMNSVAFRYFHAAGAHPTGEIGECHVEETHVIPMLLKHLVGETTSFMVNGQDYATPDGTCIRDYIHVEDIVRAHMQALQHVRGEVGYCEVFNLGTGNGYSVKELIVLSEQIAGCRGNIQYGNRRVGERASLIANADKAQALLGWELTYSIEDMVKTAWTWHSEKKKVFLRDGAVWSKL